MMSGAVLCQVALLAYHQVTTLIDFYPFNAARNLLRHERIAEAGVNAILMSLAPIGFALRLRGLMLFGTIYYFVLFAVELLIWWVPYFTVPSGRWRRPYNRLLSLVTSNFEPGDTLDHWLAIHARLYRGTLTVLPVREGRIVPNLEHMILHAWTLITAIVTLVAYRSA